MALVTRLVEPVQLDLELATSNYASDAVLPPPRPVVVAGRKIVPSPVFNTYWTFAARRQEVYQARLAGSTPPWTVDPIIAQHRFTNCYRASDRVSQFLIQEVQYAGNQSAKEVVFRTILFKLFNKVSTWRLLSKALGDLTWSDFTFKMYNEVLDDAFDRNNRLYSAAYVVPPPRLGEVRKHANHLRLIEAMMLSGLPERIETSNSLQEIFLALKSFPAMGDFLAYQFAIDLNYSSVLNHDEMEFIVAGPGARDGLRKCFGPASAGIEPELIRHMADNQDYYFERLGLSFPRLGGSRPLQLIDCQNLFCEVDKYSRVAHPTIEGISGRTRIKQKYRGVAEPISAWFPPKWGIN